MREHEIRTFRASVSALSLSPPDFNLALTLALHNEDKYQISLPYTAWIVTVAATLGQADASLRFPPGHRSMGRYETKETNASPIRGNRGSNAIHWHRG
jgi:hypothetical protein